MIRELWFRGPGIPAAQMVVEQTTLAYSPHVNLALVTVTADGYPLLKVLSNDPMLSPGQQILVDLLASLSNVSHHFNLSALDGLDAESRAVCWQAIGVRAGVISHVLPVGTR